jgi:hypothetical protein
MGGLFLAKTDALYEGFHAAYAEAAIARRRVGILLTCNFSFVRVGLKF